MQCGLSRRGERLGRGRGAPRPRVSRRGPSWGSLTSSHAWPPCGGADGRGTARPGLRGAEAADMGVPRPTQGPVRPREQPRVRTSVPGR